MSDRLNLLAALLLECASRMLCELVRSGIGDFPLRELKIESVRKLTLFRVQNLFRLPIFTTSERSEVRSDHSQHVPAK